MVTPLYSDGMAASNRDRTHSLNTLIAAEHMNCNVGFSWDLSLRPSPGTLS